MTGKRWSSGNTRPGSHPGAQSPVLGKGRRAAPLRRHPQRRHAGAERKTWCPGPAPGRAEAPPYAPALGSASGSPSLRGAGARRGLSGRSVLAAALLRDSLARCVCGQYGTFTWLLPLCLFFFLLLLCFRFFYFLFFCVCIFLPFLVPEGNGRGFTTTETERQVFCWSSVRGSLAELLAGRDTGASPAP